jgi:TolB-like protein/tetratricopeptide (TPR) repeat protein
MVTEATRIGAANAKAEAKQEETGKSIAVLPFDNRSGDAGQDYYADGLTDELTTTLARISELKVIARTSAARFKGSDKAPSAIGRELGVAALVTGSVLRAGGRIRYTAELVSAVTEKTLWADSFERDEKDVLTLQSQVAQSITKAIEVRLSPTEATRLAGSKTVDPRAFDEYLRGRALWNQRTEGSVREALQHFQNATRIAPDFALGYVGIADSDIILGVWGFESPDKVFPAAKKAAEHALELDPSAGEAHASLGDIYFHYYWDWPRSQRQHEQAMRLSPAFATAYQWDAEPLEIVGDYAGAIAKLRHAQELDPLSMVIRAQLGRVLALSGHRDEAIAELREAIALDPEFLRTRRELVRQLLAAKSNDEALLQARQLQALGPKDVPSLVHLGLCLARNELPDEARVLLRQLDEDSKRHFVSSLERARISAGLGEREATLKYLEKAVADREGNVPYLATDEEFEFLHGDPRYAAILHAIGIPKK